MKPALFITRFAPSSMYGDTRIMPEITPYVQRIIIIANSAGSGSNVFRFIRKNNPINISTNPPKSSDVINSG
jgi:hypothetical protein